jgi:threonine/homoserine/homoserine lactone efflux protein
MLTAEFFITSLVVVLIPGTGAVFTLSVGLSRARRASVFAALGCTLGILPQFVNPVADPAMFQLLGLSGIFMLMTFGVFVGYGFLAHAFRSPVIESPRVQGWLRRGFAASFAGLGVQLAASER